MKKLLVVVAFVLSASATYAGPAGNPSAPQLIEEGFFISRDSWMNFRIGYEGSFITDGRMKQRTESSGRVDNFRQEYNAGTFTLNILERVDVFGVFGSARMKADWRISLALGAARIETQSKYQFLWAVGGNILLFDWGNTGLGIAGRFTWTNPSLEWPTSNGTGFATNGAKFRYYQWQVDLALSHRIDIFIPYVGIKFSGARARIRTLTSIPIANNGAGSIHMRNRDYVGAVIGTTLTSGKYFMLNIEGRFVDEEAVSITGEFRF